MQSGELTVPKPRTSLETTQKIIYLNEPFLNCLARYRCKANSDLPLEILGYDCSWGTQNFSLFHTFNQMNNVSRTELNDLETFLGYLFFSE